MILVLKDRQAFDVVSKKGCGFMKGFIGILKLILPVEIYFNERRCLSEDFKKDKNNIMFNVCFSCGGKYGCMF